MTDVVDVLVHAADAGDTFVSWTWLDEPDSPYVERHAVAALTPLLDELDEGLFDAALQEGSRDNTAQLRDSWVSSREKCQRLAERLTKVLLPSRITDRIAAAPVGGLRMRITPSPRLARVPWELLILPNGRRLVETVSLVLDPPATVHAGRSAVANPWPLSSDLTALLIVDPQLLDANDQLLGRHGKRLFRKRMHALSDAERVLAQGATTQPYPLSLITRRHLSTALRTPRSRLFFFGHVVSEPDKPGSAAMVLSDPASTWGMGPVTAGLRPLSALDLLLGLSQCDSPDLFHEYHIDESHGSGADVWPMPSRVAVIACEGAVEFRSTETFGLVIAILNAGAELVTTTRWPLPTDKAFQQAEDNDTLTPTTELALMVDDAHEAVDVIETIRQWQCTQLRRWEDTGLLRHSPIGWASLTTTYAPSRRG